MDSRKCLRPIPATFREILRGTRRSSHFDVAKHSEVVANHFPVLR